MKKYFFVIKMLGWFFKFIFRIKFVNLENRPPKGTPFIVCSNHSHFFDVVPIGLAFEQQIHFMAKKEAFHTPFLRGVCKIMGAYPVDRNANDIGAIRKSIDFLKNGECIGIFPQGTRCPYIDPREVEPKEGLGMLASRAHVGIVPVSVRTKRNKMGLFRRTEIVVGKYISPEELKFPVLGGMERARAITKLAFSRVCDLNDGIDRKPLSPKKLEKVREKIRKKTTLINDKNC